VSRCCHDWSKTISMWAVSELLLLGEFIFGTEVFFCMSGTSWWSCCAIRRVLILAQGCTSFPQFEDPPLKSWSQRGCIHWRTHKFQTTLYRRPNSQDLCTSLLAYSPSLYRCAPVSMGYMFQVLPQLHETSDNIECYI
jgi:hypothetical protein